ncbi:MAG: hypothetical protein ACE5HV_05620 [Acidobacteriota bacterium]
MSLRFHTLSALLGALTILACAPPTAEDLVAGILATRNQFEVRLNSWVEREDGGAQPYLYLDVLVVKNTQAPLGTLTVMAEQLDAEGNTLARQRLALDVSGLESSLSQSLTLEVRPAIEGVDGLRLYIEPSPPRSDWDQFPELEQVRPRG